MGKVDAENRGGPRALGAGRSTSTTAHPEVEQLSSCRLVTSTYSFRICKWVEELRPARTTADHDLSPWCSRDQQRTARRVRACRRARVRFHSSCALCRAPYCISMLILDYSGAGTRAAGDAAPPLNPLR
ncbi:hypothetical protein EVAR_62302_1 [Eumeta japonica]|uniref:Uncharacterized protein n=1 Tax=Eumeta variegata TaxID=151549 RepID=A0A4C1ZED3_EUMVA|nr:hypothetical protein EVAR_62302_1 [Eumeta japonica]